MRGRRLALFTMLAALVAWPMCSPFSGTSSGAGASDGAAISPEGSSASDGGGPADNDGGGTGYCNITSRFDTIVRVDKYDDETSIRFTPDLSLGVVGVTDDSTTYPIGPYEVHRLADGGLSDRSNVNTVPFHVDAGEAHPAFNPTGHELFFDRDVSANGNADLYVASRLDSGVFSPKLDLLVALNTTEDERTPFPRADGRVMYFVRGPGSDPTAKDIYRAERNDAGGFNAAVAVDELNMSGVTEDAMVVSDDDLVAYFSTDRPGTKSGTNVWMAYRNSVDDKWTGLSEVPELNTDADDRPDFLSHDRCTLYFHRVDKSQSGDPHTVFVATRTPQ